MVVEVKVVAVEYSGRGVDGGSSGGSFDRMYSKGCKGENASIYSGGASNSGSRSVVVVVLAVDDYGVAGGGGGDGAGKEQVREGNK